MLLDIIVFCGAFAVSALLIAASGAGASEQIQKTMARLDALLTSGSHNETDDVDFEKRELMSSIPLLNRILLQMGIAPRLRRLLHQADVKWTPGGFLLVSLLAWTFAAYLFYLRTGMAVSYYTSPSPRDCS
jgi:hypothetical protein